MQAEADEMMGRVGGPSMSASVNCMASEKEAVLSDWGGYWEKFQKADTLQDIASKSEFSFHSLHLELGGDAAEKFEHL